MAHRANQIAAAFSRRVLSVTDWLGLQLHISSKWASRAGFLVLWGAGMTFIQVDEFSLALISWIFSATVLFSKAVHWQGITDKPRLTRGLRVLCIVFAASFVSVAIVWTQAKRADKPWTAFHWPIHPTPRPKLMGPGRSASAPPLLTDRCGVVPVASNGLPPIAGNDFPAVEVTRGSSISGATTRDFTTTGMGSYEVDMHMQASWRPEVLEFRFDNNKAITIERNRVFPQTLQESGHPLTIEKFTDRGFEINDSGCASIPYSVVWIRAALLPPKPTPQSGAKRNVPIDYFYLDVNLEEDMGLILVNPLDHEFVNGRAVIAGSNGLVWRRVQENPKEFRGMVSDSHTLISLGKIKVGNTHLPFRVDPGVYDIELSAGESVAITERLQVLYRNAKRIKVIEVTLGGKVVFSTPKPPGQPDIALEAYNATDLSLNLQNASDSLLKEPSCRLILWNVDRAHLKDRPRIWHWDNKDAWIRPHESMMIIVGLGKTEDPLYGYAVVTCPECATTKAYYIYIKDMQGWYQESPTGWYPYAVDQRVKGLADDRLYDSFMQSLLPTNPPRFDERPRIPIHDRPLY